MTRVIKIGNREKATAALGLSISCKLNDASFSPFPVRHSPFAPFGAVA